MQCICSQGRGGSVRASRLPSVGKASELEQYTQRAAGRAHSSIPQSSIFQVKTQAWFLRAWGTLTDLFKN